MHSICTRVATSKRFFIAIYINEVHTQSKNASGGMIQIFIHQLKYMIRKAVQFGFYWYEIWTTQTKIIDPARY
jgi:hypothetical protein